MTKTKKSVSGYKGGVWGRKEIRDLFPSIHPRVEETSPKSTSVSSEKSRSGTHGFPGERNEDQEERRRLEGLKVTGSLNYLPYGGCLRG